MARRRHEEEHENHERWLVSYADFITLLFAFFVVMYAISSVNEGKYRVLSQSIVEAFRSANNQSGVTMVTPQVSGQPVVVVSNAQSAVSPEQEAKRAALRQRMESMADEVKRVLAPLVRGGQVRVSEGVNGIAIEINASALFNPGEAQLGLEANRALRAVAEVIASGGFPVKVEGHTDTLPISTPYFPSNWELSAARASSVVRLFVDGGVAPARLTAAGYADQRPVAENTTPEGRARNRRVTILIEAMTADEPQAAAASSLGTKVKTVEGALGTEPAARLVPLEGSASAPQ